MKELKYVTMTLNRKSMFPLSFAKLTSTVSVQSNSKHSPTHELLGTSPLPNLPRIPRSKGEGGEIKISN